MRRSRDVLPFRHDLRARRLAPRDYGGWTVTKRGLDLWAGPASAPEKTTWKNGDVCPTGEFAGQPGKVTWMVDGKVQRGEPSRLRLKDGQVIVVGFVPQGVALSEPPNALETVQQPAEVTGSRPRRSRRRR